MNKDIKNTEEATKKVLKPLDELEKEQEGS